MEQSSFEKLTVSPIVKKITAFYGTRRFITTITSVRHCPYPVPARFIPYTTYDFPKVHLNNIPHLRLYLPLGLFPSGIPTKSLYENFLSPLPATCHSNLGFFICIKKIILHTQFVGLFIINPGTKFQTRTSSALISYLHQIYRDVFSFTFNQNTALRYAAYFSKLHYYTGR
jgi:hypothetical protein